MRLRTRLTAIGAFFGTSVVIVALGLPGAPKPVVPQAIPPACGVECHARGLAMIEAQIKRDTALLARGHHCVGPDVQVLPKTVIVRPSISLGTHVTVTRITFARAWAVNHNTRRDDDVWVLAKCT